MGLPFVCLAAHGFRASSMARGSDFGKCQTFAASPAEPGELPLWFSCIVDSDSRWPEPSCRKRQLATGGGFTISKAKSATEGGANSAQGPVMEHSEEQASNVRHRVMMVLRSPRRVS